MKIEVTENFKSIEPFVWDNIPDLSIITGLNGVGKSQLLELIRTKPDIVKTDESVAYKTEDITFWNSDGGKFPNTRNIQIYDLIVFAANIKSHIDPINKITGNKTNTLIQNRRFSNVQTSINISGKEKEIVSSIEKNSKKHILDLSFEDIMYYFPEDLFLDSNNINNDRIEALFYMYHYRKKVDEKKEGNSNDSQTPPWDLLNQVFEISNLPYEIDNPSHIPIDFEMSKIDFFLKPNPVYTYTIKLTHKTLKKTIDFKDISSGEKTIMSLAFLHYYAEKQKTYKKLLLLDEPDAHLHPSLTKQFLEVVDKFLIKKYGAKVIMTTHSPSTIGLCDENSIFIMSKNPTSLKKQNRTSSINCLTSGVPVLSSIIDNRRYILVEDKDDVTFYTRLYNLYSKEVSEEITLVFIPVSANKISKSGGCNVVREWTRKLRNEGGLSLAKGLLDRDKSNSSEPGIVVLRRYSIENYYLDPIIIAGYLIHNGIISRIAEFDFPNKNCNKLENLEIHELQIVANFIINKVQVNFTNTVNSINTLRSAENQISNNTLSEDEVNTISVELKNGYTLTYPKWIINRRGHDLEAIFRDIFSNSHSFGMTQMLDIVERLPSYFAKDIIDTFIELQI